MASRTMMESFRIVDRAITGSTKYLMISLLWVMLISITLGVFFRYFLGNALIWSEEAARFAMVWVAFLGGSLTFRVGGHVAIDYFRSLLHSSYQRYIDVVIAVAVASFLILLIHTGFVMVGRVSDQRSAAMEISLAIPYAALPIGGLLMLYQMTVALLADTSARVRESTGERRRLGLD